MLYSSCIRRVIVQAGIFCKTRLQLGNIRRSLNASRGVNYKWNRQIFTMSGVSMMVDSVSTAKRGPTADLLTGEDDDGGFVCRGWKSEDGELSCGYSSFRGKRVTMEDFFDVKNTTIDGQRVCMFGIFDGHGGSRAAEYLKEHLFENLLKHPQFITDTKLALSTSKFSLAHYYELHNISYIDKSETNIMVPSESYQQTDVDFLDSEKDTYRDDGSTASTAVLVGDHLYVANVGDSRTVISKGGKAIPLSEDHKPNRSDERKRIESAGGVVMWAGTWRVGGVLAMSRAFGNRMLKQFVVAEPEIQQEKSRAFIVSTFDLGGFSQSPELNCNINRRFSIQSMISSTCLDQAEQKIDEEFELLVLASDGLWDVVPNEDAVSIARTEEEPEAAARKLTEAAFTRGSADNITCIVVRFHHNKTDPSNIQED
ncbi:hypothetical protein POTOM_041696 [Populus tomentosa]|uniref:protein-serine/threonine phosphatase n=1 Tax=Populus tomentosa TaxID=118781 RepID=A0A8X8CHL5_POPTO|nr:hypothetical protein POTOM_041696 [Populus tomentosa]